MATVSTLAPASSLAISRERGMRIATRVFAVGAALMLLAAVAVSLWARHSFTPVEAMVALHANMFAQGEGLYWPVDEYPYTVSAYGPLFYALSAALHTIGVPLYIGARLMSVASLLFALWTGWRILMHLRADNYARVAGLLLTASTTTFLFWGTVGQVDMLAVALSLAAFERFLAWRTDGRRGRLVAAGVFVVLSIFTKQTALAAGLTITVCLLLERRKAALVWIPSMTATGLAIAAILNTVTHGGWLENAVFANINPFEWPKLEQQVRYFVLTSCGVLIMAFAGIRLGRSEHRPLYVYTGLATLIWLATAPKAGSDLNYQIEMTMLWILCAACSLDLLGFFPKVLNNDRSWITLLQAPLVLHLALNLTVSAKSLAERIFVEPVRRTAIASLAPYLDHQRSPVLVSDYDALVQLRGRTDVETLIYSLLVEAGQVDPSPVLSDLNQRRFATIVLWSDVSKPGPAAVSAEAMGLPPALEDAIRDNYRLTTSIPEPFYGPYYIYEPRVD